MSCSLSFLATQLPNSGPCRGPDCLRNGLSCFPQLCAPGPGYTKLSGGRRVYHQDCWLWHESEPLCWGLLPHPGAGSAAYPLDGLGVHPHGEFTEPQTLLVGGGQNSSSKCDGLPLFLFISSGLVTAPFFPMVPIYRAAMWDLFVRGTLWCVGFPKEAEGK